MSQLPPGPAGTPQASSRDDNIPVLTDVVHLPREPEPETEVAPVTVPRLADEDWAELAARVEASVTERMLAHAAPMLDASLDDMLRSLLERAGAQLALDLRDVFSHLVRDLVSRTVAAELTELHTRQAQDLSPTAPLNRTS